ncbi:MAG TPA: 3-hydroxyacyl-CoA dehydrogenase, partial [Rhodanobacteraceae bacterium]|nr:3-hydroxyacyl-CoA dehydrogenase [Rhodanobacteraceae bacterium]
RALAQGRNEGAAQVPDILANKVALGHLGKKTGQGLYRYEDGKPVKGQPDSFDRRLVEALIEPYLDEAQAALAEGIVADAELVDAGLIFGTGFAPFRGGPLSYLRDAGVESVRARLTTLARAHGARFEPGRGWELVSKPAATQEAAG